MTKISALVITKNAEKYLAKCLGSLKPLVREIIVVDSGSSDQTLSIARKIGARVIKQKWLGYAKQKNFALLKAQNDWVLSIDADEIVDSELASAITKANFVKYSGFYLKRKNFFGNHWVKYCGWYPDWQLRLFQKSKMMFEEKEVHEMVKPRGKIGYLSGNILHYSYQNNEEYFKKLDVYTTLDAKLLYSKKRPWSLLYQIGKPIKEFCLFYFINKGFLDGWVGLKLSSFSAYYRYEVARKLRGIYHAHRS